MTSASKSVYMDKLDDKVNKYNSAYRSTINVKPVDVKSNTYIESSKEITLRSRIAGGGGGSNKRGEGVRNFCKI